MGNTEQNWYNVLYFDKELPLHINVTTWPQLAARLMTETYPSIAVTTRVPSLFQHCNHEDVLSAGQVPWRNNTSPNMVKESEMDRVRSTQRQMRKS
jgi:hypothetical protein